MQNPTEQPGHEVKEKMVDALLDRLKKKAEAEAGFCLQGSQNSGTCCEHMGRKSMQSNGPRPQQKEPNGPSVYILLGLKAGSISEQAVGVFI